MTAEGLLRLLSDLGVTLMPTQEGNVQYVAHVGVFTPKLKALVRAHKQELLGLLLARASPAEEHPAPEASVYRRWVTGGSPQGTYKLPPPLYHDTPSAPVTYLGELCTIKACQKQDPEALQSLRYFPSGLCCRCWQRADKTVTREEETPASGANEV
jgi:TubC N-terminal docking domain